MIESFGIYRVKGVLDELARDVDTNNSLSNGILASYDEFERGWKRSFE